MSRLKLQKNRYSTWKLQWFIWMVSIVVTNTSGVNVNSRKQCEKLVIAVPNRIQTSDLTVPELRDMLLEFFTEVSQYLSLITNNQTFLNEIEVIVPNSWRNQGLNVEFTATETYKSADIRLDVTNPVPKKGNLYTIHSRGCGERGDFIYLHPEFLRTWDTAKKKLKIQKFTQEWLKLSFGIFQKFTSNSDLQKSTLNINTQKKDFCSQVFQQDIGKSCPSVDSLQCKSKSSWGYSTNTDDLTTTSDRQGNQHSVEIRAPKINFVTPSLNVIIIINSTLCEIILDGESHLMVFALRKFVNEFPQNGRIAIVLTNEHNSILPLGKRGNSREYYRRILNFAKTAKCGNGNIKSAISKAREIARLNGAHVLEMSQHGMRAFFPDSLIEPSRNPEISLWVYNSTFSKCNPTFVFSIEEQIDNFFNKFGIEDFYPQKNKIQNFIPTSQQYHSTVLPFIPATVICNYYFCSNHTDADLMKELMFTLRSKILSLNSNTPKFPHILQIANVMGWIVWIEKDIRNPVITIIDAYLERKNNSMSSVIVYSFNPNDYALKVEFISADTSESLGNVVLSDNGIDTDVLAGDKIYSGYFVNTKEESATCVVKLFAKDSNAITIAQIVVGVVTLQPDVTYRDPPRRINDFDLKTMGKHSQDVIFSWTAPSYHNNSVAVSTYRIRCNNDITRLKQHPQKPGVRESFKWTVPSTNTIYCCAVASMTVDDIWGDWSNVITISLNRTTIPPRTLPAVSESTTSSSLESQFINNSMTSLENVLIQEVETNSTETVCTNGTTDDDKSIKLGYNDVLIGVLILVLVVIILGCILYHRRQTLLRCSKTCAASYRADSKRSSSTQTDILETNFSTNNMECDQPISLADEDNECHLTTEENETSLLLSPENLIQLSPTHQTPDYDLPWMYVHDKKKSEPEQAVKSKEANVSPYATTSLIFDNPTQDIDAYATSPVTPDKTFSTDMREGIYGKINKINQSLHEPYATPLHNSQSAVATQTEDKNINLDTLYSTVDKTMKKSRTLTP